jgi:nucleoside-diphosphate-sugar epimerase
MNISVSGVSRTAASLCERILLTGSTDLLGGSVAAQLITNGHGPNLVFLVRAEDPREGLKRLRHNLNKHGVNCRESQALCETQIICGDFLDTGWLADEALQLMQFDQVFNCAAVASFSNNSSIWPTSIEGAYAFAQVLSRSARLKRFLHVGKMMCAPHSKSPNSELWEFPEDAQQLINYAAALAEIERRMQEDLPTLPLAVVRPTIVVGQLSLGRKASGSIFWELHLGFSLDGSTCELDKQIDVIATEYCAQILIGLALKPRLDHDLYDACNDPQATFTLSECYENSAQFNSIEPVDKRYRNGEQGTTEGLAGSLETHAVPVNQSLMIRALRLYSGFADLNYLLDNRYLLEKDATLPPRLTDYLDACIRSSSGVRVATLMQSTCLQTQLQSQECGGCCANSTYRRNPSIDSSIPN